MPPTGLFSPCPPIIESLEDRRLLSADLSAAFSGRLPTALPASGTSSIQIRLTDHGSTIAKGPVQVELFASADTTLDAGDFPLTAEQFTVRLRPRAGENVRLSFPTPTTLPNGDYYLLAEVTGSAATIGSPEVAVSPASVSIQTPFSDLSLEFATLPSQPIEIDGASAGRRIATVFVTNSGNIPVHGKMDLSLYLSSDNVLDGGDPLLATANNRPITLKPGGHSATGFRIAVPPGTVAGGYFLIATLTPAGNLIDSNAADNVAVSSRRVAVVTQLPPTPARDRSGYGSDGSVVDQTTVVAAPDCPPDTAGCDDSTGDAGDSGNDGSQDDSSDTSDPSAGSPAPSDSSSPTSTDSSTDDSSDTWDDGSASDGGDF